MARVGNVQVPSIAGGDGAVRPPKRRKERKMNSIAEFVVSGLSTANKERGMKGGNVHRLDDSRCCIDGGGGCVNVDAGRPPPPAKTGGVNVVSLGAGLKLPPFVEDIVDVGRAGGGGAATGVGAGAGAGGNGGARGLYNKHQNTGRSARLDGRLPCKRRCLKGKRRRKKRTCVRAVGSGGGGGGASSSSLSASGAGVGKALGGGPLKEVLEEALY